MAKRPKHSVYDPILNMVPELRLRYQRELALHRGRLKDHEVFGDVVFPFLRSHLHSLALAEEAVQQMFEVLEEMADGGDERVVQLLRRDILEILVFDQRLLATAWRYMGPTTRELSRASQRRWHEALLARRRQVTAKLRSEKSAGGRSRSKSSRRAAPKARAARRGR
jgi:hypothetical protein